uniref:SITS-binding protein-like n=1 Tax=Sinocyclocheilus grahami TaxID=75366 RepID=A0A672LAA3_SINGR
MPHSRNRNPSPIPEVTWDTGLKEMNETWKGAIACLGVAVFFVMTIGIIYWQVVDQPNKNWILKGSFSGLIWERRTQTLVIQTLTEDKTFAEIDVENVGNTDIEVPFVRNMCWLNKTEFCYTWDSVAEVKISLESSEEDSDTECYSVTWTPIHCHVDLKDCFSMVNISWYGGASVHAPSWPINDANISMQPFTVSDLRDNPSGFGSVLERYFLGSSGVSVLVAPNIPLHVGMESRQQFCLQTPPSMERMPLQYTVCVGHNIRAVHQESMQQLSTARRELPNMDVLWLPFWKLLANVDSGAKLERELRTFSNRLKRHHLGEGVVSLDEHSTALLASMDHSYLNSKKRMSKRQTRDLPFVKLLNISITLSPYLSVDSQQFQTSIQEGIEDYWLSLPSGPQGRPVPLLTQWKGKYSVKLNITNPEATNWFLDKVDSLHSHLGMEYVILEGGEGNPFEEQALRPPLALVGDEYIRLLADLAERIGENTIVTSGTRSRHKALFIRMSALQSDWSYSGLKGIIPSLLHHSLLGYNFFIPDAVGGSLSAELVTDDELFVRWLGITAFLPVISFQTPPWVFEKEWVSATRNVLLKILPKYTPEYSVPSVLVAPVTEKGALQRDIYLPESDFQWQDTNNAQVFDGGTFLESYPVGLGDVAVFVQWRS